MEKQSPSHIDKPEIVMKFQFVERDIVETQLSAYVYDSEKVMLAD